MPGKLLSVIFILIFGIAQNAIANTYYVSTGGDDDSSGSSSAPFRTIAKATVIVKPGDKVIVRAGVYYEHMKIMTSGTVDKPIVFEGERGPNGEWNTIIDGSVRLTSWTLDPSIGSGVYKAAPPFKAYWLGVGNKDIFRASAVEYITKEASATWHGQYTRMTVNFWDGFEALWFGTGTATFWPSYTDGANPGNVWVRFRNGDDPNVKEMRVSNGEPSLDFNEKSYNTVKNFEMRGSRHGVWFKGASSVGNVLESNHIMNGGTKIIVEQASSIAIRNNKMHRNGLSSIIPGPFNKWSAVDIIPEPGTPEYIAGVREKFYLTLKEIALFEYGYGIQMVNANGSNNVEISGNEIYDIEGDAIVVQNASNVSIFNNTIHNCSSISIMAVNGYSNLRIHDNLFYDCNITIRWHGMDLNGTKQAYFFRNRSWLSSDRGSHMYWFWNTDGAPVGSHEIYLYQNSFAGGDQGYQFSPWGLTAGLPNVYFFNNIMSANTWANTPLKVGAFDYNMSGGSTPDYIPWSGSGNTVTFLAEEKGFWDKSALPSFSLSAGSAAIGAGIDLSKSFMINGKTFGPLPGMQAGYFSGVRPDLGAVQYTVSSLDTTPPIINSLNVSRVTETTADIAWMLSEPATGVVEYGTTTSYGSSSTPEQSYIFSSHQQTITNLTPGTLYHFRVRSSDAGGNVALSQDLTFATTPSAPPNLNILAVVE